MEKNQIEKQKEIAPETLTEELSKEILKEINDIKEELSKKSQEFFQISEYAITLQQKQLDLVSSLKGRRMALKDKIQDAYKKMKLNKNYNWRFDDNTSFVGQLEHGVTGEIGSGKCSGTGLEKKNNEEIK